MHKTGNVVVEGVAIGKIQFLNADYEEQIKRYMTGTEEEEKKRYQEAHTLAKDDLDSLLEEDIPVQIADAPILEGAISAAVQAAIGGNLKEVIEAAELAKQVSKLE